jgi:hypothetical protein
MAKCIEVIWVKSEPEYFCEEDWTGSINLIRFNKLRCARRATQRDGLHNGVIQDHDKEKLTTRIIATVRKVN